ncbi:MAG: corrinoid protein [Oscillospiraceae bacterium]|nr:corrinoid protein [Oscillospiraceae bacterium]
MAILEEISSFLQQGRAPIVKEKVQEAIDQGLEPKEILEKGLLEGMGIIGEKFKKNEVFVPEVLIAARAMNAGVAILKPYLVEAGVESKGTVVIGTVKGDLHDIGKNLVKMMLEGKGLKVIDLGVDVPSEQFIQAAIDNDAQIICCSALLTTTMNEMKNVVIAAQEKGIRNKVKIMVGGAPITQNFCDSIGADGYTADAASAADAALAMCS